MIDDERKGHQVTVYQPAPQYVYHDGCLDLLIPFFTHTYTHTHTSPYKKVLSAEAAILTYLVALSTIF